MTDILIRGMEMPNVGEKIEFTQNITGRIYAKFNPSKGYMCEVIELPEHGDLIDRDAFMNDIQANDYPVNVYGNPASSGMSTSGIKRIVNSAPVVIPSNKETKNAD